MDQFVGQNVDTLFHGLENFTQKEGIIGKPVTQGDKTFIPVLSVTIGYGSGNTAAKNPQPTNSSTMKDSTGGALGLGAKLCTDAIIVVDKDNVQLLNTNSSSNVSQIIDKMPQIVSQMNQSKSASGSSTSTTQ